MRRIVLFLAALAAVLAAAWLGLWWVAEGQMQDGLTRWVNQMNTARLQVSYDAITRGTSPLAATVTMTDLRISVQDAQSAPVSVTLPSFALRIEATDPLDQHIDYPDQISVDTPRGEISVTFGSISAINRLNPRRLFNAKVFPITGGHFAAGNINVLATGSIPLLHIDQITAQSQFNTAAGPGAQLAALKFSLNGMALSPLFTRLANIPFGGRVNTLGFNVAVSGPAAAFRNFQAQTNAAPPGPERRKIVLQILHGWAAAGGSANGTFVLAIGPSTLNASGAVKFDASAQPSGTAVVTADHLDAFTAAITDAYPMTQNQVNALEARLSPYLGLTDAGGQVLNISLGFGQGAVTVNGEKVAPLVPINWQAVENSPAP